jgi:hypothetical protein
VSSDSQALDPGSPRALTVRERVLLFCVGSDTDWQRAGLTLLSAHGLGVSMIAGFVSQGLATLTREQVKAGAKMIEVAKVQITEAGRKAVGAED